MFLMRRAKNDDVSTLLKLAKMVHFINLPAEKDIITDKAMWSRQCFQKVARQRRPGSIASATIARSPHPPRSAGGGSGGRGTAGGGDQSGLASLISRSDLFMFVLEDTESGGVLGTSQVIARMGGPGSPNVSFALERREMFSKTLQVGATHTVAKLYLDESGPTEIGGLILQPSYRGHKSKLGRFLSLVRFHFIGLYPELFSEKILAEMMAPITPDGRNTLWEYLGRRFINLTYTEADRFCQYSKEFITSLLPREEIYLTLLPPEARSVIAQVGPETVPARRMLEKLGFAYNGRIDPFDGGPNLEAVTRDITIVRDTRRTRLADPVPASACKQRAMISTFDDDGEFLALDAAVASLADGRIALNREHMKALNTEPGEEVGYTPLRDEPAVGNSKTRRGTREVGDAPHVNGTGSALSRAAAEQVRRKPAALSLSAENVARADGADGSVTPRKGTKRKPARKPLS